MSKPKNSQERADRLALSGWLTMLNDGEISIDQAREAIVEYFHGKIIAGPCRAYGVEAMTPVSMVKLATALERSADHDKPEDKRSVMFSVARSLFDAAETSAAPHLPAQPASLSQEADRG